MDNNTVMKKREYGKTSDTMGNGNKGVVIVSEAEKAPNNIGDSTNKTKGLQDNCTQLDSKMMENDVLRSHNISVLPSVELSIMEDASKSNYNTNGKDRLVLT